MIKKFDSEINPEFEDMGYELAGAIEFYENPKTGKGAFKAVLYRTSQEDNLEPDKDYTDGQIMVLVTQKLLEEYINREVH